MFAIETGGSEVRTQIVQIGRSSAQSKCIRAEGFEQRQRVACRELEAVTEPSVESCKQTRISREAGRIGIRNRKRKCCTESRTRDRIRLVHVKDLNFVPAFPVVIVRLEDHVPGQFALNADRVLHRIWHLE